MSSRDRKMKRAAGVLPLLAFGAFLGLTQGIKATEEGEEAGNYCKYAGQDYSVGACVTDGCWWWDGGQRCTKPYATSEPYWDGCGSC